MAHKKGGGSTRNGRGSNAQYRGVKVYGGEEVRAGGILFVRSGRPSTRAATSAWVVTTRSTLSSTAP